MCMRPSTKILSAVTVSDSVIFFYDVPSALRKAGFVPAIASTDGPQLTFIRTNEHVKTFAIPMRREISVLADLFSFWHVSRTILSFKPDVVNAGTPKAGLIYMLVSFLLRVRCRVYHVRGLRHESLSGFSRKLQIWAERLCGYLATDIICETPSLLELAVSLRLFSRDKCFVLGPGSSGIQLHNFQPSMFSDTHRKSLRNDLGIPENAIVIGFVGRLVPRKGVCELLDAWLSLKDKYPLLYLLFVGPIEKKQPLEKRYIELIESDQRIKFVGRVDSPSPFYNIMDIFTLPAHWEGFGNVLVEAAAMGLPVITTNGTGTVDAVCDNYNGKVVDVKSATALRAALEFYVDHPNVAAQHGANGKHWAVRFDRQAIIKHLIDFYTELENRK